MAFNYFNNSSVVGKKISGVRSIDDLDTARLFGLDLFSFSSFTFTRGGGVGHLGQALATFLAHSDYDTTAYSWLSDTSNFNVTTADGTYPLGIQLFTIPKTGTYRIEARGAHGGSIGTTAYTGGIGARIKGDFDLVKNDKLEILVGHPGTDRNSTQGGACGGGGSFVIKEGGSTTSDILIIAGGGGGAEYYSGRNTSAHGGSGNASTVAGGAGSNSTQIVGNYGTAAPNYTSGSYGDRARGGINGYGGGGSLAGGGGGFFDRGGTGYNTATLMLANTQCGYGYLTGTGYTSGYRSQGGRSDITNEFGGFGCGAGARYNSGYGGGGGGYSGGGGGSYNGSQGNGGGGGSYNSGTNKVETTFTLTSHPNTVSGYDSFVTIELL